MNILKQKNSPDRRIKLVKRGRRSGFRESGVRIRFCVQIAEKKRVICPLEKPGVDKENLLTAPDELNSRIPARFSQSAGHSDAPHTLTALHY